MKDEEGRNPPDVNKQLNDEKQSMVNSYEPYIFFISHNMYMYNEHIHACKLFITFELRMIWEKFCFRLFLYAIFM